MPRLLPDGRYQIKTIRVRLAVQEAPPAQITTAGDAARILAPIFADLDADQEHFVLLALNTKLRVVGFKVVASGTLESAPIDPRIVFRAALFLGASAVIVAHNHPSGDPEPSPDDYAITERLRAGGQILGLEVMDHVVMGNGKWVSLRERGRWA